MPDITLPKHARAVVIGAGIVGCSVAYHLTKLGWREIVVIDQGPLFETGGSTSHAPGLVFQINPSKTMTEFARYSVDLWTRLHLDGEPCAKAVGSLEVAWTPERLADLKRKHGYGLAWGVECYLLSAQEARARFPLLSDRILGALYVPSDIQTKATRPAEAMARAAERTGAKFFGGIKATGFGIAGGRITAVHTTHGDIETDLVVAATGIWAPKVGGMANVPIPLSPMQHLYAVTTPLPELAGASEEISLPFLRHQDKAMYFRQEGESIGIGSYLHEPLLVDAADIPDHAVAGMAPAELPFAPTYFEAALDAAGELMPSLKDVELTRRLNGIFSFTNDGFPVLGESPQLRGFWSAQAVWITHAGGVGKAVAEWIVNGEPEADLRECDIRRFHPHALRRPYVRARAAQQYREVYDIIHPRQQMDSPRNLRLTPFYARQQALGAVFFENAGWERPQWYDANQDLLGSLTVTGASRSGWAARGMVACGRRRTCRHTGEGGNVRPDALRQVRGGRSRRTRRAPAPRRQSDGQARRRDHLHPHADATRRDQVRPDCNAAGGEPFHDRYRRRDGTPRSGLDRGAPAGRRLGQPDGHLIGPMLHRLVGAAGARSAQPRLRGRCERCGLPIYDRAAANHSRSPRAGVAHLLCGRTRLGNIRPRRARPCACGTSSGKQAGRLGVIAAGGGGFDSLRLEKGYRLWGNDIHTEYNPYEAGLGFAVRMAKGDFLGRDALVKLRAQGTTRRLCCMTLDNPNAVVMGKEPIMDGDDVLGYVTSANYGHSIGPRHRIWLPAHGLC